MKLKVLHLIGGDMNSGAAKGAYLLHKGLIENGIQSKILTNSEDTFNDPLIYSVTQNKFGKITNYLRRNLDKLPLFLYKNKQNLILSCGFFGYNFIKHPLYKWADIIHLHWINAGFVNYKHLKKIKKPIVWTMRDMGPITGGCHIAEALNCDKYKNHCGNCVQLNSKRTFDLSKIVLKRKEKYIPKQVLLVGISNWLSNCAKESSLFRNFKIKTIYNNINTKEYYNLDKNLAKKELGLPTNKKIILAEGQNIEKQFYKGFDKFLAATEYIDKENKFFIFFGNTDENLLKKFNLHYKNFGFIKHTKALRFIYNATDIFVAPSLMDSFGKTIAEAMACGTPVVCFNATGPGEIITHKVNGYKAEPYCIKDLAEGIEWVLNDSYSASLNEKARRKVISEFDYKKIASTYIENYIEEYKNFTNS